MGVTDDSTFCEYLLNEHLLAVVPGTAFGSPGHFRLSFASSLDQLKKGMNRLEKAISKLTI